jgi:hypothetical protein
MFGRLTAAVLLFFVPLAAVRSIACSIAGCSNDVEIRRTFSVVISDGESPLSGVSVEITGGGKRFAFSTGADGRARVNHLPPGDYWINARFLGITAAHTCFHVQKNPTAKAASHLAYDWGAQAQATQRITGRLVDVQQAKGGTPLWNAMHHVDVPIVDSSLKLQDPLTGAVYATTSDNNGQFSYDAIPSGRYALHIEGGTAGDSPYDSTDELIELNQQARFNALRLVRTEGGCGGTTLELRTEN